MNRIRNNENTPDQVSFMNLHRANVLLLFSVVDLSALQSAGEIDID